MMRNIKLHELTTLSPAMGQCLKLATLAAQTELPVLVLGESGTGKTLLTEAIHRSSRRSRGPFVSFNASAMSDTLLESQLFGHERGAFTGAHRTTKGKFELADHGTLFLDEIADMSLLAQAKVLRAVEYGEFERLGSEITRSSNARIISATHCSLIERIQSGRFRGDLYHRLNGLTLVIPPLRDRREDLPGLIASELRLAAAEAGKEIRSIHTEAMGRLLAHPWPGNLRELHHAMRTIALMCEDHEVGPEHIHFSQEFTMIHEPGANGRPAAHHAEAGAPAHMASLGENGDRSLAKAIHRHVHAVYLQTGRNQRESARILGISRARLVRHLQSR